MSIQADNVNLNSLLQVGGCIREYRRIHEAKLVAYRQLLAQETRRMVYEGRTDFVQTEEVYTAVARVFRAAGFSDDRKVIERYL